MKGFKRRREYQCCDCLGPVMEYPGCVVDKSALVCTDCQNRREAAMRAEPRYTIEQDQTDYQWRVYRFGRMTPLHVSEPGNREPSRAARFSTPEEAKAWLLSILSVEAEITICNPRGETP